MAQKDVFSFGDSTLPFLFQHASARDMLPFECALLLLLLSQLIDYASGPVDDKCERHAKISSGGGDLGRIEL